jgi:phosphoserine aminotransferase
MKNQPQETDMKRIFNFSAGPATLPEAVLRQVQEELLDWHGCGMGVMEMSHRDKEFMSIAQETEKDLREVMAIPANYKVLFMQGGATAQFGIVPQNLLRGKSGADYVLTGDWGKKAAKEFGKFGKAPPTCTSPPTRPFTACSSVRCRTPAACRWWRMRPRTSPAVRSTSAASV